MPLTWIFDLDNTLHDTNSKIFPVINKKMAQYISQKIGLSSAQANIIREDYWNKYGSTLRGLIKNYHINPAQFLEETHHLPNINELICPMRNLRRTLRSLKGRKIIFTNGPKNYALTVLRLSRILIYFDEIHSIEDSLLNGKPSHSGMRQFLSKHKIKNAVFIDDERLNLRTANRYGLKTVWLNQGSKKPNYISQKIRHLDDLLTLKV